jgi:hypothetical protein
MSNFPEEMKGQKLKRFDDSFFVSETLKLVLGQIQQKRIGLISNLFWDRFNKNEWGLFHTCLGQIQQKRMALLSN